jgi:hypothetical protein
MANLQTRLNRTRFSLSKKAVISFVFSKLAFLIFGVIITSTFFFVLSIQKDIQSLDKLARTGEAIIDITAAVSASPFNTTVDYTPKFKGNISINNDSFILSSNSKNLTLHFYHPINQTAEFDIDSCLRFTKTNSTVISTCQ